MCPGYLCKHVESTPMFASHKSFTTEWQVVEKGITTVCTMSVILFVLAMRMLVVSCKDETKGPKTASGQ